jgi:hypothetical protein
MNAGQVGDAHSYYTPMLVLIVTSIIVQVRHNWSEWLRHCHGTFLSLLSLRRVTFLPEEVIVGFPNFAWGVKSQQK